MNAETSEPSDYIGPDEVTYLLIQPDDGPEGEEWLLDGRNDVGGYTAAAWTYPTKEDAQRYVEAFREMNKIGADVPLRIEDAQ